MSNNLITFSIVSHGQIDLVHNAVQSILSNLPDANFIITINIPEDNQEDIKKLQEIENLNIIHNKTIKGFGENHNYAFRYVQTKYFCVCNPDVIVESLDSSFDNLFSNEQLAFFTPKIVNNSDENEDNLRIFPNFKIMVKRLFGRPVGFTDYVIGEKFDWCAGMFMVFLSKKFDLINGFDDSFYMYYEDADICGRLAKLDNIFISVQKYKVLHDARRGSRKNLYLLYLHVKSALKFLIRLYFSSKYKNNKGYITK